MANLVFSQKAFLELIQHFEFQFDRLGKGSHRAYKGFYDGQPRSNTIDFAYDEYSGWLLDSMISQSGIPKKIFRDFRNSGCLPDLHETSN